MAVTRGTGSEEALFLLPVPQMKKSTKKDRPATGAMQEFDALIGRILLFVSEHDHGFFTTHDLDALRYAQACVLESEHNMDND